MVSLLHGRIESGYRFRHSSQVCHPRKKMGADIGFEDEAGVGVMTRSGRTWGEAGRAPEIPVSMEHGGYNLLSMITLEGTLRYTMTGSKVNSEQCRQFLFELIEGRPRPLILLTDHASFHQSQAVREFVRAHRSQLRVFFLPKHCPELSPGEQVGNEIKHNKIDKQPVKDKNDLGKRLFLTLRSLQNRTKRIQSFFELPDTIAVIKWMEYINSIKILSFQSVFRYLHKFLCFYAGNNRYKYVLANVG